MTSSKLSSMKAASRAFPAAASSKEKTPFFYISDGAPVEIKHKLSSTLRANKQQRSDEDER
jgi:hypothetical protein